MIGEVTCGGSPHLSCKRVQNKMRDFMDRRVTSPTLGPPPPCKQALSNHHDEKKTSITLPTFDKLRGSERTR